MLSVEHYGEGLLLAVPSWHFLDRVYRVKTGGSRVAMVRDVALREVWLLGWEWCLALVDTDSAGDSGEYNSI